MLAAPWIVVALLVPAADPQRPDGWKLVWSDEFDGPTLDRTKWDYDFGNGFYDYSAQRWISGWGNDELQYYTDQAENVFLADGLLHLRTVKQSLHGCGYTSGKVKTRRRDGTPLFAQRYGRFEFRALLPTGRGIWPALWMLPQDEAYGGWASSGEIDVVEARGQEPRKVLGTLHYGGRWPANASSGREHLFVGDDSIARFHVYAVEWEPGAIRWSVDGRTFAEQDFWWSTGRSEAGQGRQPATEADLHPWPAPFDRPFYLVMNVAVGGRFLGNPDAATPFPAEMLVDYVRVYEQPEGPPPLRPRGAGRLPFERP